MRKTEFYIVDVFAEQKYAGNQLAVFMPGHQFSAEEMQQVAREMNFSETTFILSNKPAKGGYEVRIFTPGEEVPFAGHPTLGTAYVIHEKILAARSSRVVLNLKVGQITVTFESDQGSNNRLWMKQIEPRFHKIFKAVELAGALNLSVTDFDEQFPIQEVSTGLPFIIVPLKSLAAVKRCLIDKAKYFSLIENTDAKSILVFSRQTYEPVHQLNVRVFVDYFGVPEDPATGSGNGCLTAYLVKYRYLGSDEIDVQAEQGYEIGRPSLLYLRGKSEQQNIQIFVGGRVIPIARGEWI